MLSILLAILFVLCLFCLYVAWNCIFHSLTEAEGVFMGLLSVGCFILGFLLLNYQVHLTHEATRLQQVRPWVEEFGTVEQVTSYNQDLQSTQNGLSRFRHSNDTFIQLLPLSAKP